MNAGATNGMDARAKNVNGDDANGAGTRGTGAETARPQRRFARAQRRTIGLGILSVVALIVILQLWLFTASMNAYLGGSFGVLLPAALGSAACLALNLGLLWYLRTLDR